MATVGAMEREEFVDVAISLSEENPRGRRRQPFVAVSKHGQLKHPKIGGKPRMKKKTELERGRTEGRRRR
jgi:hypothetical protein